MDKKKEKLYGYAVRHRWFARLWAELLYPRYRGDARLNKAIATFADEARRKDEAYLRRLRKAMYADRLSYRVTFEEYFLFSFPLLNAAGKRSFVGDAEKAAIMKRNGTAQTQRLFDNKYETYLRFRPYFGRDVVKIASKADRAAFDAFLDRHGDLMVKAIDESCGRGIYRVRTNEPGFSRDALFANVLQSGECLLEERIEQDARMGNFHPESVNTLRVVTFVTGEGVDILFCFLRFGQGESCVDNGGAGGIFVLVDPETGLTITEGVAEDGTHFLFHPNTGLQLPGFRVPRWDEAIALSKELALVVPEHPCVGWDLALTDGGWIVVEGNGKTMFIGPQITTGRGVRKMVEKYFS
ncbi:MAG: hypothetical protein IJ594_05885 [Oscillospiraceae bacterium]|nr:hypothetical protein [Oscillospiraceae bacterium]